ncbi:MAG: PorV/PorQ family protein [Elusimicrobia bacterium]|nr:PorV/PorQ family protein [Elusimicrobiota bacterium]
MIRAVLLVLLAASPALSRAGEPGTAGATFLKLGAGPRAIGMGETHTAVADDAYASYWNPAGLAQLEHPELALMHDQHFEGIQQQYLAYVHPLTGGAALGANLTRLAVSPFDSYNNNGVRTGTVSSDDLAAGVAAAKAFTLPGDGAPSLCLGTNVKYVRERLARNSAETVGADLGLLSKGWERWLGDWARGARLGLAVRHLGPSMRFVSEGTPLPTTVSMGAAVQKTLWDDPLTIALDVIDGRDTRLAASFGAEYWVRRTLAVRLGYKMGQEEGMGLRAGIGVRLHLVQLDYSFAGFGELGNTHRAGISIRFGAPPQAPHQSAKEVLDAAEDMMRQARYYEAVLEINRALQMDPGSERAVKLLKEAHGKLSEGVKP